MGMAYVASTSTTVTSLISLLACVLLSSSKSKWFGLVDRLSLPFLASPSTLLILDISLCKPIAPSWEVITCYIS